MLRSPRKALALFGALLLCAGLALPTSAATKRKRETTLAPGVTMTVIRNYSGPFRIRIITVDRMAGATLDTVLANDKLPKFETTSSMAARSGALAAVNGDYARSDGRPVFTFAADGHLAQTPLMWGRNFAVTQDKSATYIGHPEVVGAATEVNTGTTYAIPRVNNGAPAPQEVVAFTKQGGAAERAPAGHCLVRVIPSGPPRLRDDGTPGTEIHGTVDIARCGGRSLRPRGGIVLATPLDSQYAPAFAMMAPGEEMSFTWSMGWPGVLDTVGGNPTLIEAGQIVGKNVYGSGPFFARNPRTGVGTTPDGRILLVAVDGRQPRYSVGMTLEEFANLFASLGADWALNLDGGGSTTFVVDGEVKNRPSDGEERPVSSALVVLPGSDPGEVWPTPEPTAGSTGVGTVDEVWGDVVGDPGSTGGLAAYLKARGMQLPASMERAALRFRSSR
jgi:hypothetical protein